MIWLRFRPETCQSAPGTTSARSELLVPGESEFPALLRIVIGLPLRNVKIPDDCQLPKTAFSTGFAPFNLGKSHTTEVLTTCVLSNSDSPRLNHGPRGSEFP